MEKACSCQSDADACHLLIPGIQSDLKRVLPASRSLAAQSRNRTEQVPSARSVPFTCCFALFLSANETFANSSKAGRRQGHRAGGEERPEVQSSMVSAQIVVSHHLVLWL